MKKIRYSFDSEENIKNTTEQDVPEDFDFDNLESLADFYDDDELDELDESDESNDFEKESDEFEDQYKKEDVKRTITKRAKGRRNNNGRKVPLKYRIKRIFTVGSIIIIIGGCVAVSPVFGVNEIVMNDLHYFTKEELCKRIGLYTGKNGFLFNRSKAEDILKSDPYISDAEISFKIPDTMIVAISEERICGYIEYLGSYLYIDRKGIVIDIKKEIQESLPIIEGLKFSSFTISQPIPVENNDAFQSALSVSNAMSKYGILDSAVSINISNPDSIYAYVGNIKVLLGDNSRMEEKIKTMAEAVKALPEGDRGTLDLTDLSKPVIFKYTT